MLAAVGLAAAAVPATTASASVRDLEVSASFDKPSYATGEAMRIAVTVRNPGPALTLRGHLFSIEPDAIDTSNDTDFERGLEFTLGTGESVTNTVTGVVGNPELTTATLYVLLSVPTGESERFTFSTAITAKFGDASGVVFEDANDNGRFDDGEGLPGAVLTFRNLLHQSAVSTVTTGAGGAFAIRVPTSRYIVSGTGPGGLLVGTQYPIVDESGVDGLLLRAVAPVSGLAVTMAFTKDSYARDEAPSVTVTLANSGDRTLNGIIANCNRSGGEGPELDGSGAGWGELVGAGVSVPANGTTVLTVTEPMPGMAYDWGYVQVGCDFGYRGIELSTDPRASGRAEVPGLKMDATGVVTADGAGLPGVRVVLVSGVRCAILGQTTTGADGRFALRQMPAGMHRLYLVPPAGWHIVTSNPALMPLIGSWPAEDLSVRAERGDGPAPALPHCAPAPPVKQKPVS